MAITVSTFTTYAPSKVVDIVSQDSTSYEEILQSMAGNIYAIKSIYISAPNVEQILLPLGLFKFDANGNANAKQVTPTVDPTQYQTTLNIEMDSNDYVLNGRTTINYQLLAGASVYFVLRVITLSNADFLNDKLEHNLIDFMNDYNFYEGYTDKLEIDYTAEDDD